jgi:serine/threonine protein kinase
VTFSLEEKVSYFQKPSRTKCKLSHAFYYTASEARILFNLEHPNIIKLRAVSTCPQDYFLVLDRLYDTLQTRLKQWKTIAKRQRSLVGILSSKSKRIDLLQTRLFAAYDLTQAIGYLHDRRILHRDVKPENIGFDVRGDIKLFDFGLAREMPDTKAADGGCYHLSHMTGSLRYMAPEVALGKPYNEGCDVYSFATVFHEMLSLQKPYKTISDERVFRKRVFENCERPRLEKKWPKACREILEGGWTEDLSCRFSIADITTMLRSVVVQFCDGDDSSIDHTRRRSTFVYESSKYSLPSGES